MALSQADFYAYSRATGAPVPQDPEEQARMAPAVLEFRRNQLRAPRQEENDGFDVGDLLGVGALAAGVGAGAYGLRRGLAGRGRVTVFDPSPSTGVTPETAARAQAAPDRANYGAVGNLVRDLNPTPSKEVAQQQNSAIESGEDQFTGRQLREVQRDTDATTGRLPVSDQVNTQRVSAQEFLTKEVRGEPTIDFDATYTYKDLQTAQLPEFEINARMQAYANTGDKALLNPNVNSKTIGHYEYLKALGVRNAKVNNQMQLVDGELVNPEGDVRMSAFAKKQTAVSEMLNDVDTESYDPISEQVTGLTQGASTSDASFKLSEQYDKAIQDLRGEWDSNVRENVKRMATNEGDYSDIVMPARTERRVDFQDLDIPVNIEKDSEGQVLSRTLYRDTLSPEIVSQIEKGENVILDVPFKVNKSRAYLDYKTNPTLTNKVVAKDYQRTGRALVQLYQKHVGPYEESKYIPNLTEGTFFDPGETGITPKGGPGSQRGKLVGGAVEETLSDTLSPLKFQIDSDPKNKFPIKIIGFDQKGSAIPVETLDELNSLGPLLDQQGNVLKVSAAQQQNAVLTQPMSVRRIVPVLETDAQGNTRQRMAQRTAKSTGKSFSAPLVEIEDHITYAPLQVFDATTNQEVSGSAQISRAMLNRTLDRLEGELHNKGLNANYNVLADRLNQHLINTQNIKLPVLSSNTAFNFIENVRGRPGSRSTRVVYGTTGSLGESYPISANQIETFLDVNQLPALGTRKTGQNVFSSTTRSRQATGVPTLNIQEAPKGTLTGISAEDEDLLQQNRDVRGSVLDAEDLPYSGFRSVELGSARRPGLGQQQMSPATTGTGAELQQMRSAMQSVENKNWQAQFPHLASQEEAASLAANIDTAMTGLLARAGRRAGSRRNR
jgi:hypothetical protein